MLSFCLNNPTTIAARWGNPNTTNGFFNFENLSLLSDKPVHIPAKPKYSVKFAELCRVVLVPKREEYKAAGIVLWWTPSEFNQFKRERYAELTQEPTQSPSPSETPPSAIPKSLPAPCFILNLSVLVCTSQSSVKCPLLANFSRYLWSDGNPDRQGTSVSVTFSSPEKVLASLLSDSDGSSDGSNGGLFPDHNIVLLDHSPPPSATAATISPAAKVTCEKIRRLSQTAVIICIMESEAAIQSNDDSSAEEADLLLPHPEIPSCAHWNQLINLLILRKEASDFLPSPLVQQYITAL